MRTILYIGNFKESFSTENYVTYGLQQLGCKVLKVEEIQVKTAKSILGAALEHKVDFVLFSKAHFTESHEAVQLLKEYGIPTAAWLFDLYFDVPFFFGRRTLKSAAFKTDVCFMTDGGHKEEWKANKVNHKLLRQGIHAPEALYGEKMPHAEIVFIGSYSYPMRTKIIGFLKDIYGSNFVHYGEGGNRRQIRGMDLNNVLASVKIVVGDSIPADFYWSNRIYEILGRGGFLLHPAVEGLYTEFIHGTHYIAYEYGNLNDLKKLIDYYLIHDKEREKIKSSGHKLVKTKYTYTARCKELLKQIDVYKDSKH